VERTGGQVVIVTDAASGIGRATAVLFAERRLDGSSHTILIGGEQCQSFRSSTHICISGTRAIFA
jgi:hypothetical protein